MATVVSATSFDPSSLVNGPMNTAKEIQRSFRLPEAWRQDGLTHANLLPPELRSVWFTGVECSDCHRLLLQTMHHFSALKADYLKNYARNSDCSALMLVFAQSLPLDRYENALSYELFRYGQIVLKLTQPGAKERWKFKDDLRDRALGAISGLYTTAEDLDLAGNKAQRAFAIAVDKLLDTYVRQNFGSLKGSERSSHSVLSELHSAISKNFAPFVSRLVTLFSGVTPPSYFEDDDIMISDQMLAKWQAAALDKLGQIRSSQILDILQTSHKLHVDTAPLQDLREYLVKPSARKFITTELTRQLYERFLHPAASTVEVLAMYMILVEAFRETDPSGVVIHRVSAPIRSFLMGREDAVKIIISSLLEDFAHEKDTIASSSETFCAEIAEVMRATKNSDYSEYYESKDLTDDHWLPDPADAVYGHRGFNKADRMSHLITLEEKGTFIKELQNVLGERLLRSEDYNFEKELELLRMFRMRFEEYHITQCEIMLRDAFDSRRIDEEVHSVIDPIRRSNEPDFHAKMISKYYWPALRDETFVLPRGLAAIAERYGTQYRWVKADRRLEWLNALGRVSVELELSDRTIAEEVTTWQAAVIYQFHSDDSNTLATSTLTDIISALQMDESLVRAALTFWVGKLVLRESTSAPDTFTVLERLPSSDSSASATQANNVAAAAAAAAQAETAAASSTLKSSADLLQDNAKIYSSFIVGMLTNQGAMPAKRVHMMLKMVVPGGFPFEQEELVGFMNELVKEERVERAGMLWKIVKKNA